MIRTAFAIAAALAVLCFDAPSSEAQIVGDAPWCAVFPTGAGNVEHDCEYYTVQECVPNVIAGNRGSCVMNPAYRAPPPRYVYSKHHWRHYRRY
jgi:Protein of unknown function (DUF3551)